MLRRVIVPFVELFFVLLLVFIALYLVTASLVGEGNTRAQDELHTLEIELTGSQLAASVWFGKLPDLVNGERGLHQFSSGRFRALGFTVEAASLGAYTEGLGWDAGWSVIGRGDWMYQDSLSVYSEADECIQLEETRWFIRDGGIHKKRPSSESGTEPSMPVLEAIAAGSPSADFTAVVEESIQGDTVTWNLKILFQPKEISRETVIRVGIPILPLPEASTSSSGGIKFTHEVLTKGVQVSGEIVVPGFSSSQLVGSHDFNEVALRVVRGEASELIQSPSDFFNVDLNVTDGVLGPRDRVPVFFDLPDCRPFPRVYLYGVLSSAGVKLTLNSPE